MYRHRIWHYIIKMTFAERRFRNITANSCGQPYFSSTYPSLGKRNEQVPTDPVKLDFIYRFISNWMSEFVQCLSSTCFSCYLAKRKCVINIFVFNWCIQKASVLIPPAGSQEFPDRLQKYLHAIMQARPSCCCSLLAACRWDTPDMIFKHSNDISRKSDWQS